VAETLEVDICVIGAGSAGLSVAAAAAMLRRPTVLIERGRMGGDCLNFGCVPSKSLIAAARAAEEARLVARFGVRLGEPVIDYAKVHEHVQGVIAAIAPHDSAERFEGLGCRVIRAQARFTAPDMVEAGDIRIRARRFVLATGSAPAVPPIPGLAGLPFLTNETIFDLTERPEHLIVIGGGPIGLELAQAERRLGARVSVVEMGSILAHDDPEAVDLVRQAVRREGVALHEGTKLLRVERDERGIAAVIERAGGEERLMGSHLLVAAGRRANLDGLGLEAAGIAFDRKGITTDRRLRTSNRRVYAIGDAAGRLQFTHVASYHAGIVIRNALFRLPAKLDERAIPWVTYTDPELAQVGLQEAAARQAHGAIRILRWPYGENDRAQTERATLGFVKVIASKRGHVLGATIVGRQAGELIAPWILAIARGLKLGALASLVLPYPTLGEINKSVAGTFFTPALFSERTRRLVGWLARLG
jgi:pyruvate/2-oxoglutarate dehydrogenase complex dihydrolipoamide dehydrogenase (E3) component